VNESAERIAGSATGFRRNWVSRLSLKTAAAQAER
jgi:hypothetical protein